MENTRHHRSVGKSYRAAGHPPGAGALLGNPTTPRLAASDTGLWTAAGGHAFVANLSFNHRVHECTFSVRMPDRTRSQKLFASGRVKTVCESKDQIIESPRLINKERMPSGLKNLDLSSQTIFL